MNTHDLAKIEAAALRVKEVEAAYRRRWFCTPCAGKKPILPGWPERRLSREEALDYASTNNMGVVCGLSRVFIVDGDLVGGLDNMPVTPTVETGGGGRHYYFNEPDIAVSNSAGKLGHKIDVRAGNGQAILPGSVHPVTGKVYRWAEGLSPEDVPLADVPAAIIAKLTKPAPTTTPPAMRKAVPVNGMSAYLAAALDREVSAIANAPEGVRNDTLNKGAFSLGQFIGGGELDEGTVAAALYTAAEACGLVRDDGEASVRATIRSGLASGRLKPRRTPAPARSRYHDKIAVLRAAMGAA